MSSTSLGGLLPRPEAGAALGLIAVLIFFAFFGGVTFLKPAGMASWLNVAANLGVIAIPLGLLMIAGELDISVGAMVPFGAMTVAVVFFCDYFSRRCEIICIGSKSCFKCIWCWGS